LRSCQRQTVIFSPKSSCRSRGAALASPGSGSVPLGSVNHARPSEVGSTAAAIDRVSSVYQTRVVPKITCPTWCVGAAPAGRVVAMPAALE
jgi:hypothetical protein